MKKTTSAKCPKCGTFTNTDNCPKCGLLAANFNTFSQNDIIPDQLKILWEQLQRDWTNRSLHALFIEQGLKYNMAEYTARCYFQKKDNPLAREQMDKITSLMISTMDNSPRNNIEKQYKFSRIIVFIFIFLLTTGISYLLIIMINNL
jgi:hypothetical protein